MRFICVSLRNDLPELCTALENWCPSAVVAGITAAIRHSRWRIIGLARQLEAQKTRSAGVKSDWQRQCSQKGEPGLIQLASCCRVRAAFKTFLPPKRCANSNTVFPVLASLSEKRWALAAHPRPGCVVIGPVDNCARRDPAPVNRASLLLWEFHTDVKRNRNWPRFAGNDDGWKRLRRFRRRKSSSQNSYPSG